jgi:hypothetical protein
MTKEGLRLVAKLTAAVLALFIIAGTVVSALTGSWQPLIGALWGSVVAVPIVATWLLAFSILTNRTTWFRDLAWIYNCDQLQPELQGWRRPIWRGSDDWPGDDTYWRRTVVLRIPGRRYLVVAVPIRRKHKETT